MSLNYKKLAQDVADQHNIVRTNPKAYVSILEKYLTYFKGDILNMPGASCGIQTTEGKKAYQECIEFLKKQKPVGKVEFHSALSQAANDHVADIGPQGICGHEGTDGSSSSERIERHVQWDITCAENIDFGATTGQDVIISLIVDDGVPDRGHRKNIFNPDLKFIGIASGKHAEFEHCTVLDYVGDITKTGAVSSTTKDLKNKAVNSVSKGVTSNLNAKPNASNVSSKNNISTKATSTKRKDEEDDEDTNEGAKVAALKNLMKNKLSVGNSSDSKKPLSLKDDPDAPKGAVKVEIKTSAKTAKGKRVTTTEKTYTLKDGSQEILTETLTEDI